MLYEFELSADKVSSKNAINLPLPAKVAYLNRGQLSFVMSHYDGGKTADRMGFEQTSRRIQDLQRLVIPNKELKAKGITSDLYAASFKELTDYLFLLRSTIYASKGCCKRERMSSLPVQTGDLTNVLSDGFEKPNFEWREVRHRIVDDTIQVFTDTTFTIDSVVIDYLRYPVKIDVEGYIHFDESESSDVDCELPEYIHGEIIKLAALELDFDLNNPGTQSKLTRMQTIE